MCQRTRSSSQSDRVGGAPSATLTSPLPLIFYPPLIVSHRIVYRFVGRVGGRGRKRWGKGKRRFQGIGSGKGCSPLFLYLTLAIDSLSSIHRVPPRRRSFPALASPPLQHPSSLAAQILILPELSIPVSAFVKTCSACLHCNSEITLTPHPAVICSQYSV